MSNLTNGTDNIIQTLDNNHVASATDLFIRTFCDSEPITKHLGIRYQDYELFAKEVIQKAVKDQMSKVIVNQSGKVIAFAIAEDLADPFIPHQAHYSKLIPVFLLLEQLSRDFIQGKEFLRGKIVHVWVAGVDQAYRGQGLSTQVDLACVQAAARKGYDFAYAEFTNEISENVIHQFKTLKLFNRIAYDDFQMGDGSMPFKGVKGAAASYLATIRPGVNLDSLPHCYKVLERS